MALKIFQLLGNSYDPLEAEIVLKSTGLPDPAVWVSVFCRQLSSSASVQ